MDPLLLLAFLCRAPRIGRRERGATAVEYALMLSVVVIFIFGAVLYFGGKLNTSFRSTANTIPG